MLVDGHWALEIAERLKVSMETEYTHESDLRTTDEWILVMQEELETIRYIINHKKNTLPVSEEDEDAD